MAAQLDDRNIVLIQASPLLVLWMADVDGLELEWMKLRYFIKSLFGIFAETAFWTTSVERDEWQTT